MTLGAHNVAADTAVSSTTDHALTGVLVTGWKNTRFERRGWMRVRQVIIPLASLPDGVVPTETDTLLFDGAEWTIVELEHPVPAAAYLLHVVVT
ncbi:MAG: hypothetical protein JSR82_24455 [Verrucomicrobia bacterium]|nr:hypothetical protein [Verrucomicrobiota bacterium]